MVLCTVTGPFVECYAQSLPMHWLLHKHHVSDCSIYSHCIFLHICRFIDFSSGINYIFLVALCTVKSEKKELVNSSMGLQ